MLTFILGEIHSYFLYGDQERFLISYLYTFDNRQVTAGIKNINLFSTPHQKSTASATPLDALCDTFVDQTYVLYSSISTVFPSPSFITAVNQYEIQNNYRVKMIETKYILY